MLVVLVVTAALLAAATPAAASLGLFGPDWWMEQTTAEARLQSTGGGVDCAACTIVVSILEQLAVVKDQPIEKLVDSVCERYLPAEVAEVCEYLVDTYGDDLVRLVESGCNPDEACSGLTLCTMYPEVHLWPVPSSNPKCSLARSPSQLSARARAGTDGRELTSKLRHGLMKGASVRVAEAAAAADAVSFDPWQWLNEIFGAVGKHLPEVDVDGDKFSSMPELRGSNWRGRDCAYVDSTIYPGRAPEVVRRARVDDDCNGIFGVNDKTGKSYEAEMCAGTGSIGMAVMGDSAGAHFEIPPQYMNASEIHENTYDGLFNLLLDEVDWPLRGGYTGFEARSAKLPYADSLYKKLFARNHCNHRDYQNCCVNGARAGATADGIVQTLARNASTDKPLLLFLELIGNDVCNPHKALSHMTTPVDFERSILQILRYLDDGVLPKGSHVVTVGLADGLALWDNLHNRTHPLGVKYVAVYDFLNGLSISPCWVWMNSNATIREAGQARANELSAIYPKIIAQNKFNNFDVVYTPFPLKEIAATWAKTGGKLWQLIEPVDGFHPNQIANSLMADYFYKWLSTSHPSFIGGANPNNAAITSKFGDQGGY